MDSTKPTDTTNPAAPAPRKRVKVTRSTKLMGRFACAALAAAFACYVTISNPVLQSYGTPAVAGMSNTYRLRSPALTNRRERSGEKR